MAEAFRTHGPYRVVRHPIYAGAVLAYAGLAVAQGDSPGLIVYGAHIVGYVLKARVEDHLIARSLGEVHREYRDRVRWHLIPGVW